LLDKPTSEPDYAGHQPIPFRVDQIVPRLIYTRLETIRSYEPLLAEADMETLHALRIDFKRLRYTLEFFQEVLGEQIKLVINEVKQMQDHLGDLNDAVVAVGLIEDIEEEVAEKKRGGLKAYREFRQAEAERLVATFPEAWASFDRHEVREALAVAIAVL
jgi:CHAD domain-containing protein